MTKLKAFLIGFLLPAVALAAGSVRESENGYSSKQFFSRNYVQNYGAEENVAAVSASGSATVSRNTTSPIEGKGDFSISLPNNATDGVTWSLDAFDSKIKNGNCYAEVYYTASSIGSNVKVQAIRNSVAVGQSPILAVNSDPTKTFLNFPCGDLSAATTLRIQNDTGNSGTSAIKVDQVLVGLAPNIIQTAMQVVGGTITEATVSGVTYNIHTFTSSGQLCIVSGQGNIGYEVVAGGGGGGTGNGGGGGGGGILSGQAGAISGCYTVTVGAGGAGAQVTGAINSANGGDSSFVGYVSVTATGGGRGGSPAASSPNGGNGGSGGGSGNDGVSRTAGTGTSGQGYNGGVNTFVTSPYAAPGGGGAGGAGANNVNLSGTGGAGGVGLASVVPGSSAYYGGGGGGSGGNSSCTVGAGGNGGGGNGGCGSNPQTTPPQAGTANTGGGGGGGNGGQAGDIGGAGGSGRVAIWYPKINLLPSTYYSAAVNDVSAGVVFSSSSTQSQGGFSTTSFSTISITSLQTYASYIGKATACSTNTDLCFKMSGLPAGKYEVTLTGGYFGDSTNTSSCDLAIYDGTTRRTWISSIGQPVDARGFNSNATVPFEYTGVGDREFKVQIRRASGTGTCFASFRDGADASSNIPALTLMIKPLSQNLPAPVLVGSVTSGSTGAERIERVRFGGASERSNCTTSPCTIYSQSGSWVSSVTKNATGNYTVNIASGVFSAEPTCSGNAKSIGSQNTALIPVDSAGSSTSKRFDVMRIGSAGTNDDAYVEYICYGPR